MASTKKPTRIEKRARYEISVVESCRNNYLEKFGDTNDKIEVANAQLSVLLERGRLSHEKSEQIAIAHEIRKIRDALEILKDDADCFQDNVDMFDELLTLLNSFFMKERFGYIVRKIPEKKLPAMVRNPDRREDVNELLMSILQDFQTAWQKYLLDKRKRKERRQHVRKVKENFRERNEIDEESELSDIIAEFRTEDIKTVEDAAAVKVNKNKT